ncbi:phosphatases II [Pilatotrama ljubarskyi]|nr:phosphatases II [Pilatotrama ljubarskyi]
MSIALVDPHPVPLASRRISRVASEPISDQTACVDIQHSSRTSDAENDPLVAQLGKLASQHHASEYNRLKYGPRGSPFAYVPYSVQMPDHYRVMQAHQTRWAQRRAWWPSENSCDAERTGASPTTTCPLQADIKPTARTAKSTAEVDLQEQLSAAISSPLITLSTSLCDSQGGASGSQAHWQTSETHPIVISTILPSELLPVISSHLERCTDDYPTVFRLPQSHLLDRLMQRHVEPTPSVQVLPPVVSPPHPPCPPLRPPPAQSIAKTLKLPNFFWVHPTVRRAFLGGTGTPRSTTGKRPRPASFAASSATSYPDLQSETHKRPNVSRGSSSPLLIDVVATKEPDIPIALPALRSSNGKTSHHLHHTRLPDASNIRPPSIAIPEVPPIPPVGTGTLLGNLYMSSCPGKKVRLDGPVRGRSTVCRDLRADLCRIKDVGVACIVCLLDDNELQSLGVTWNEYVHVAGELGIDLLRMPIPEGLPPNDPALLDSHLSKLIETYTLRGSAILVHCRGGVGRAGIIACCWMLKLGLCGWLDSEGAVASTMRLIERMIAVVRRRRSPKAVETYEQVKFLVDYINFLREQAQPQRTSIASDWFADWDLRIE